MAKACDFYIERDRKEWCAIKKGQISYATYNEYCKNDYFKKCPIYQFYEKEKEKL